MRPKKPYDSGVPFDIHFEDVKKHPAKSSRRYSGYWADRWPVIAHIGRLLSKAFRKPPVEPKLK